MIAEAVRRSALADYAGRFVSAATGADLAIRELSFVSQMNLRADPNDSAVMQRIAAALGFPLPTVPNTVGLWEDRRALWLSPDEWLIVGAGGQQDALEQTLRSGLNGGFGSVVDVSANRTLLEIRGARARELLGPGVPVDLDARTFGPGDCAQTMLAKAQVVIERRDESGFVIYVRTSFAVYVASWLLDALAE